MSAFTDRFATRPASYSFFSSWEYNRDEWYKNYIMGIREPANEAMLFGSLVGDSIGTDTSMVPTLVPPGVKEYELSATLWGIPLVGYADHYCPDTRVLHENKTSATRDRWTQKKVDEHTQLTMYCLLLWLRDKVKPEDVRIQLNFIPVRQAGVQFKLPDPPTYTPFTTTRTMLDILEYTSYLKKTLVEMERYVQSRCTQ
jgi:hypothetical protein